MKKYLKSLGYIFSLIITLTFLVTILNYIGLFTCFISVIIIIFIIFYLNRKIFRLEYLEEIELEKNWKKMLVKLDVLSVV